MLTQHTFKFYIFSIALLSLEVLKSINRALDVTFAHFRGVNVLTMADVKLPLQSHYTGWEGVRSSTPLYSLTTTQMQI